MKRLFLSLLGGVCLFGSERALASMEIHESKNSSSSANSFNSSPGLGYETIVIIRDKQGSCEYSLKYPGSINQFMETSIAPLNLPTEKRKMLKSEPVTKRVKTDSLSKGNQENQQALLKGIPDDYVKNKDSLVELAVDASKREDQLEKLIKALCQTDVTYDMVNEAYWAFMYIIDTKDKYDDETYGKVSSMLETVKCRIRAGQSFSETSLLKEYNSGAFGPYTTEGPFDAFDD